jgi:hypothetical protein
LLGAVQDLLVCAKDLFIAAMVGNFALPRRDPHGTPLPVVVVRNIERLGNKYRVSADCRADRDLFYTGEGSQKPLRDTRIFEIWLAKPGARWRENESE